MLLGGVVVVAMTKSPVDELIELLTEADACVYYVPPGTPEEARKIIARLTYENRDLRREIERLRAECAASASAASPPSSTPKL